MKHFTRLESQARRTAWSALRPRSTMDYWSSWGPLLAVALIVLLEILRNTVWR